MLTTKQRAQLRALANPLADTLIIGKEGVTDAVERQLDQLLEAHELVKGKVLESAMLTPRTVAEALSEATGADTVQCIGSKFVLYRQARDKDNQQTQQRKKDVVRRREKEIIDRHRRAEHGQRPLHQPAGPLITI